MAKVVCMSFSSKDQAEKAKSAIHSKDETPFTILQEHVKWGLFQLAEVSSKGEIRSVLENLPSHVAIIFYVGVEEEGGFEVLRYREDAYNWLKS